MNNLELKPKMEINYMPSKHISVMIKIASNKLKKVVRSSISNFSSHAF